MPIKLILYAHLFLEFTKMGIDVAGESQLVGFPSQFPDVSMINWKNGNPNSRYWVLKLLIDNFGPSDKLVPTAAGWNPGIDCQAFITKTGRKLLMINKHDKDVLVMLLAGATSSTALSVDTTTRENPPVEMQLADNSIMLKAFSVTVVEFK